jgi:tetratricopeptide (TPR) repeat protein
MLDQCRNRGRRFDPSRRREVLRPGAAVSEQTEQRLELARHYLTVGNPQRALDALAHATAVDDEEYWELRAAVLLDLDRWQDAAEAARGGLALEPDNVFLLDMLAIAELELEHGGAALDAIDAALEIVPDHPTLLAHRSLILARLKRFDEAEHAIDEAMAIEPEAVDVLRVRSQVSFLKGDLAAATEHADELLEADPDNELSHLLRGNVAVEKGRYRHAVRHFEEAARLNPEIGEIRDVLRENRVAAHPILAPVRPIWRVGRLRSWLIYLTIAGLLAAAHLQTARIAIAAVWITIVAISWLAPPLLRRWYGRGNRGF